MVWAASGYVFTALTVSVAAQQQQAHEARKRVRKARKDQLEDEQRARDQERFAKREGEGIGELGKVDLGVDDLIDPKSKQIRKGSTLQI
jgi:hypothetical protein|tara:strand:- start:10910 stop:11176 length:267 start_codon:yes stop_codon:yes gene_type:complete